MVSRDCEKGRNVFIDHYKLTVSIGVLVGKGSLMRKRKARNATIIMFGNLVFRR